MSVPYIFCTERVPLLATVFKLIEVQRLRVLVLLQCSKYWIAGRASYDDRDQRYQIHNVTHPTTAALPPHRANAAKTRPTGHAAQTLAPRPARASPAQQRKKPQPRSIKPSCVEPDQRLHKCTTRRTWSERLASWLDTRQTRQLAVPGKTGDCLTRIV